MPMSRSLKLALLRWVEHHAEEDVKLENSRFLKRGLSAATLTEYTKTWTAYKLVTQNLGLTAEGAVQFIRALVSCGINPAGLPAKISALRTISRIQGGSGLSKEEDKTIALAVKAATKSCYCHTHVKRASTVTRGHWQRILEEFVRQEEPGMACGVAVGLVGVLRAGEIVNLRWSDITFTRGKSRRLLMIIQIQQSKTSDDPVGIEILCTEGDENRGRRRCEKTWCPVHLVRRVSEGIVRRHNRVVGKGYKGFTETLRRVAADIGISCRLTGHSIRRSGMALLYKAGWSEERIGHHARHKTSTTSRYILDAYQAARQEAGADM